MVSKNLHVLKLHVLDLVQSKETGKTNQKNKQKTNSSQGVARRVVLRDLLHCIELQRLFELNWASEDPPRPLLRRLH